MLAWLGQNVLNVVIAMGSGAIIAWVAGKITNILKIWIIKQCAKFGLFINSYIKQKIKDPFYRSLVVEEIALIQKKFGAEAGEVKFEELKNRLLEMNKFDVLDKYIGIIAQTIYDELIAIKLQK